jgi:hypothetical protein
LVAIKSKLAAGRDTCLLFDTPSLVRNLENLYRQMWEEFVRGELPVPDLQNLEIYHDTAVAMEVENADLLTDDEYSKMYKDRLSERHDCYPVSTDLRMWRKVDMEMRACAQQLDVA